MSLKIDRVQLEIVINNDQARKSLRVLDEEARQLTKEMKKLKENTEEYAQKAARLKAIKVQQDAIYESIGITNLTMKELTRRQSELNGILLHIRPGTEEYKKLNTEVTAIRNRIGELKGKAQQTGMSLKGMADGFNRYFGLVTAFAASFTGLIIGFKKAVDMANEYGKSVANLSALTGLAGKELKWLSDQAKDVAKNGTEAGIKTTQGAQAIVDAYTKVGSARPELLKNKQDLASVTEEALILAAAANGELEPAVNALAGVLNQFNLPASESRRIINSLAAGSKEGAGEIPYLTEAIEKSGTIAADAGISIESLVGIIETLAPRMAAPEMAGRNLRAIILKLQEGADETNPSIVGFSTAIENLAKQNLSATELTKLFGLENITAAKILINNRQETENYIKAVTGTNTALEQAAINTNTDAAAKERAINNYETAAIALGEKLSPAITISTNAFTYLIKAINTTADFLNILTGANENSLESFDNQLNAVVNLNTQMVPLLDRYDELATKANKSSDENNELKLIIGQVADSMPFAITQFDEYGNAISISTGRIRDFIAAETDRLKVVNKSAIEQVNDQLKNTDRLLKDSEFRMKQVEKEGTFMITEAQNWGGKTQYIRREATKEEIAEEAQKYRSLLSTQNGYRSELKRLNGDALADELQRREKERKAAEEAESKKVEYSKKTKVELEALAASGDEYAEAFLVAKNTTVESTEQVLTAFEKLKKSVSDARAKVAELVVSGDLQEAMKADLVADSLERSLEYIQEIIDAGGDLSKVIGRTTVLSRPDTWVDTLNAGDAGTMVEKPAGAVNLGKDDTPKFDKDFYLEQAQVATDAAFDIYRNGQDARFEREMTLLNRQMEAELSNKNLTEEQKEAIRVKYAAREAKIKEEQFKKQKVADVIQATINTALAITRVLYSPPLAVAAGIAGAAQIAAILSQPVPQFAKGKYSVIGAEDGKRYNADWTGKPETRIYSKPSLVAEQGGELIVDAQTTKNLMMNYPGIIESIYAARMPQRASGNLMDISPEAMKDPELLNAVKRLNENLEKGIKGKWVLHDLEDAQDKLSKIKSNSTL